MKVRIRQSMLSVIVFVVVMVGLSCVDDRVRDRFSALAWGTDGATPWATRASDLGSALVSAFRHQSIENAPLLVFATVGAVLFLFMVKT